MWALKTKGFINHGSTLGFGEGLPCRGLHQTRDQDILYCRVWGLGFRV